MSSFRPNWFTASPRRRSQPFYSNVSALIPSALYILKGGADEYLHSFFQALGMAI